MQPPPQPNPTQPNSPSLGSAADLVGLQVVTDPDSTRRADAPLYQSTAVTITSRSLARN